MKRNKSILYLSILLCIVFLFSGCSNNVSEKENIEKKVNEEIDYLQNNIISIINKNIKGEYIIDEKINWYEVENDINSISNILDTILLDLAELDIEDKDLANLRNEVNNLIIATAEEDELKLLNSCSYLYSLLPNYMEKYSKDINKIDILKLKSYVITSMIEANSLNWKQSLETIDIAESYYNEMLNNLHYIQENSYNMNKIYVLLEELKNVVEKQEVELCKVKYINFIEKIS